MTGTHTDYASRYPSLHTPSSPAAGIRWAFSTDPPAAELVTNVHVVGFVGERIVVCRATPSPVWFLPGGTRERGESIEDCAARELTEEAGVSLAGPLHWVGAHYRTSALPAPYRPWQPHPNTAWLWCYADVQRVGAPTNPPDGEQVVEVRVAEPEEAQELVRSDNPWAPELVALAREIRATAR